MFPDEARRFRRVCRERGVEVRFRRVVINNRTLYQLHIVGCCPLFDAESRSCTIHEVKPLACKMFPLLFNPSSMQVLISLECTWVRRTIEEVGYVDLSMFPNEVRALRRVLRRLLGVGVVVEM